MSEKGVEHLGGVSCDSRLPSNILIGLFQQLCWVTASLGQNSPRKAVGLFQKGFEQMLSVYNLLAGILSDVWGSDDALPSLFGELVLADSLGSSSRGICGKVSPATADRYSMHHG